MPDRIIVSAPGPQGPAGSGGGGSISDGDKGDITVSGVGTVWTVDAGAINTTKLGGDITTAGKALLDDADAAAQRTTLGLGTAALEGAGYFATATHTHIAGDIDTFPTDSLVGRADAGSGVCRDIAIGSGLTIDTGVDPPELKTTAVLSQYVETTRTLTAGTGLTGGGTLAADRSFNVAYGTSASTACEGNDSRLSDARTPTAHTHDFVDSYVGHIEAPAVGTYYIDTYAAGSRTVTGIHIVTGSGTVDWTLRRVVSGLGSDIYTADGQGSTQSNITSGLSNTALSAGNQLELQIDATSSGADVRFTIVYSRTTGAIT
jgi:hypothetical protein